MHTCMMEEVDVNGSKFLVLFVCQLGDEPRIVEMKTCEDAIKLMDILESTGFFESVDHQGMGS